MLYQMKLCGLRISQQRQLSGWRVGMSKSGWLSAIPLGLRGVSALFIALISSFCRRSYPALSLPTSSQVTIALNPTKWGKKRQKGGRGSWNSGFGISRTFCTKEYCVALWTLMTKENMRKDHLPWGNRWEIYLKIEGWGIHTSRWKLVSPKWCPQARWTRSKMEVSARSCSPPPPLLPPASPCCHCHISPLQFFCLACGRHSALMRRSLSRHWDDVSESWQSAIPERAARVAGNPVNWQ